MMKKVYIKVVLLIERFLISNYYFPSEIEIYEGLVKVEGDVAILWDIIGQSLGILEVKFSYIYIA